MTLCPHCGNDTSYPVGASAQAMHTRKLGFQGRASHPLDPADLRRCSTAHGPEVPVYMRGVSPAWDTLVDHWVELVAMLEAELAAGSQRAQRTYGRMRELLRAVDQSSSSPREGQERIWEG